MAPAGDRSGDGVPTASIRRVAVIGAGVMGSGIVAQVANAGVPVDLYDVVPGAAAKALKAMAKQDPAPLMDRAVAKLVTPRDLEDSWETLAEADWIVEAVVEKLEVKRSLYGKISFYRREGAFVSSNTSTIRLRDLVEGQDEAFRANFLITHFFNPPRYMRLLEIVRSEDTREEAVAAIEAFADRALGKTCVPCADTPGFVANRIGTFWFQAAFNAAFETDLPIEEADAALTAFGIPKTGVFGLADLVGIDLLPYVAGSLKGALPADDPFVRIYREHPLIAKMIREGATGRKGTGGFYRLKPGARERVKQSIGLVNGVYEDSAKPRLEPLERARREGLAALLTSEHRAARFAVLVMGQTLAYAASLLPEIGDDVAAVDDAMRLGYNWRHGPFELLDRIGPATFRGLLERRGQPVPELLRTVGDGTFYKVENGRRHRLALDGSYRPIERPAGVLLLEDVKLAAEPLAKNGSAALWDVGDGVVCLEFTSKSNTIDDGTMTMIATAIEVVQRRGFKALVVYNEGRNFSVGANLGLALFGANVAAWPVIEGLVKAGQDAYAALRYAPFPVVAAPSGLALGGGCEIALRADAIQAHAETYIGLVETGVGVVPAWGGCAEMLRRWQAQPKHPKGPMPAVTKAFETIGLATVAKSAAEAKRLGFLAEGDGVTMNRDRLLFDAKRRALALAEGYAPPERPQLTLPGLSGVAALQLALDDLDRKGQTTPHDKTVAARLARVLTGGEADPTEPVSEDAVLALEREAFMALLRTEPTLARMERTLDTGKPLRN